ncbi:UbiD family decarboxylase [Telmatocola sphagniphila]|uniref:UbiD family decarboxylase n=1 Tax=Telmatocola sphagniphila TaxID=1123043 RepID=A0A8E6EY31_9BACT|nr:UbiD family decarboxylase [Telmatocola sphagniphila]QVL32258.1 UbiD family decarboxylase [Telmatocola sphagniphila]
MAYRNLIECVRDLERHKQLVRIDCEVDPYLEIAEIQRRLYARSGPAVLFTRVKGCRFPMLANLFGTLERTRFLFRDTLDSVRQLIEIKADPSQVMRNLWRFRRAPFTALKMLPRTRSNGAILANQCRVSELPQLVCWPNDGGAFVTLPLVLTEDPHKPGWQKSNLGMYRVQLSGNEYLPDQEIGIHYQIHRGIGVHHAHAIQAGKRLPVAVLVGGPPSLTVSAVMPLPEGLPELTFAGALGGRAIRLVKIPSRKYPGLVYTVPADVDFAILGVIDTSKTKPEGPFGDHLGYYSLRHDFPCLDVETVYHRRDAIWPFTVVGRPPQEDTSFGEFIHELTGPIIPTVIPGIKAVHAVDAAGVHPLLLAIGSERYVPYARKRKPQELLTTANAVLGLGQLSLAKFLLIVAREDDENLDIHDIPAFLAHLLQRIDWKNDLHFQTRTTIDTLDYSGSGLNEGSKVVMAAAGPVRRQLCTQVPAGLRLPADFTDPRLVLSGIVAVRGPRFEPGKPFPEFSNFPGSETCPILTIVDDSDFSSQCLNNWLWVTFTRTNPAADLHGIGEFLEQKHWGCSGPLIIDARIKPHHAPPLIEDPAVTRKVNSLATSGQPLHNLI